MTSDLLPFIENAIKEQQWPYKVIPQESGFILQLLLDEASFIEDNAVLEAFEISVTLEHDGNKSMATIAEKVYPIIKKETGELSLGDPATLLEPLGTTETETVASEDSWKLFIAKRWLISILKFKNYSIKEPKKTNSRVVFIVILVIAGFAILAAAFSGIATSMANGAIAGIEEVSVEKDVTPDSEILSDFYN